MRKAVVKRWLACFVAAVAAAAGGDATAAGPVIRLPGYPLSLHLCATSDDLQACIVRYGRVRLSPADYTAGRGAAMIRLGSEQAIYGLGRTRIPPVLIANGATGALVSGVMTRKISFEPGPATSSGNMIVNVIADISGDGARVAGNRFIRVLGRLSFDNRAGGLARSNLFVACYTHAAFPAITLLGGDRERSGGNSFVWFSFLTPAGTATHIARQSDVAFAGIAAESWNYRQSDNGWAPLIDVRQTGRLSILGAGYGTGSAFKTPFLVSGARENVFVNVYGNAAGPVQATARRPSPWSQADLNTLAMTVPVPSMWLGSISELLQVRHRPVTQGVGADVAPAADGADIAAAKGPPELGLIRSVAASYATLPRRIETVVQPAARLERPTGGDEADALQRRLDAAPDGILYLAPGTYRIGHTLDLRDGRGIVGSGSGTTKLVAIGAIDLVRLLPSTTTRSSRVMSVTLSNLTLEGGRNGVYATDAEGPFVLNQAFIGDVVVRGMSDSGFKMENIGGLDNNFLDHVAFVDNAVGFNQILHVGTSGVDDHHTNYVDKVVFYGSRFQGNGIGAVLHAGRQDNQNAWIDSVFAGNRQSALVLYANDVALIYGTAFRNNGGRDLVVRGLGRGNAPPTLINVGFAHAGRDHVFVEGRFSGVNVTLPVAGDRRPMVYVQRDCPIAGRKEREPALLRVFPSAVSAAAVPNLVCTA